MSKEQIDSQQSIDFEQNQLDENLHQEQSDSVIIDKIDIHNFVENAAIQRKDHYKLLDYADTDIDENLIELPLESYKSKCLKEMPELVQFTQMEQLNEILFNDPKVLKQIGRPRCLCSQEKIIAVGGSLGGILIFRTSDNTYKLITSNSKFGSVCSLTISDDKIILVIGYESGALALYNLPKNDMIKYFEEIHQSRILLIRILFKNKKIHNRLTLITTDEQGYTKVSRIMKGLFSFSYSTHILIKRQFYPILQVEILNQDLSEQYFPKTDAERIKSEDKNSNPADSDEENDPLSLRHSIVSLSNAKRLWVVKIYLIEDHPTITIINIKNPVKPDPKFQLYNSINWGEGNLSDDNKCLLLMISWNNLLQFVQIKKGEKFSFHMSKSLDLTTDYQDNIIYSQFIGFNLICILTIRKGLIIFNTRLLNIIIDDKSVNSVKNLQYDQTLKDGVLTQLFTMNEEQEDLVKQYVQQFSGGSITYSKQQGEISYICDKGDSVMTTQIKDWEYLTALVVDRGEWVMAMSLLSELKLNTYLYVPVRQVDLEFDQAFSEQVLGVANRYFQLITSQIQIQFDAPMLNHMLIILFEFLIKTNQCQFLFDEVMQTLWSKNLNQIFADSLKTLINSHKLNFIPQNALLVLINLYRYQEDQNTICELLIQLDMNQYDNNILLQICLEGDLIKPLIFICNNSKEQDFFTPLIRMWQLSNKSKDQDIKQVWVGKLCYYLYTCIKQKGFGGIKLEEENYKKVIQQFSDFVFQDQIIESLINFDLSSSFEIFFLFFQMNVYPQKFEMNPLLESTAAEYLVDQTINAGEYVFLMIAEQKFSLMLKFNSKKLSQKDPKVFNDQIQFLELNMSIFICKITLLQGVRFLNSQIFNALKIIIQNQIIMHVQELYKHVELNQSIYYLTQEQLISANTEDFVDFLHQNFLIKVCEILSKSTQFFEENIKELCYQCEASSLNLVCSFLLTHFNLKKGFEIHLTSKNQLIKYLVFHWLYMRLNYFITLENKEKIRQAVVGKLSQLILMNAKLTIETISRFYSQQHKPILQTLNQLPQIQLEYLDYLFKDNTVPNEDMHDLLKLHISLLCQLQPEKVLKALKEKSYPVDESLLYTIQYGVREASAFLLERNGAIDLASKELFDEIEDSVRFFLKNALKIVFPFNTKSHILSSNKSLQGIVNIQDLKAIIDSHLNDIIQILIRNKKYEQAEPEWYVLLNKVILIQQFVEEQKSSKALIRLIQFLEEKIATIIQDMSKHTSTDYFVDQLYTTYKHLKMSKLKFTFLNLISSNIYSLDILLTAKDLLLSDLTGLSAEVQRSNRQGISSIPLCSSCGLLGHMVQDGQSDLQETSLFYCGHLFHKDCMPKILNRLSVCPVCLEDMKYLFMIMEQSNRVKLEKLTKHNIQQYKEERNNKIQLTMKLEVRQIPKQQKHLNLEKLRIYDKQRNNI